MPRVLGAHDAVIDLDSWEVPPLFQMIVDAARIERDEAYQALNMGIGMVLFVEDADLDAVEGHLAGVGEESIRIGRTAAAQGERGVVRWA